MKKLAFLIPLLAVSLATVQHDKSNKGHGHGNGVGGVLPPPPPAITCNSGSLISMSPGAWCVYGTIPAANPIPTANGWMFSFPLASSPNPTGSAAPPELYAVTTDGAMAFSSVQSMTITFRLIAVNANFQVENILAPSGCTLTSPTADFSFYMLHSNDFQDINTWRWWAFPEKYIIKNGTYDETVTLTVQLQPQFWSDVNGMNGATDAGTVAGFMDTLANVATVGINIGSGCFAGHGTLLESGIATIEVQGFSVQ